MPELVDTLRTLSTAFCARLERHSGFAELLRGGLSRESYVNGFLVDSFHDVLGTPDCLRSAARVLRHHGGAWAQELARAMDRKAQEESIDAGRGHEYWALADIQALTDLSETEVRARRPSAGALAYNDFLHESARHFPIAILGIAYPREYMAMRLAPRAATALVGRARIPAIEQAVQFLRGHGEADVGHVSAADRVLSAITDPGDQALIVMGARVSIETYLSKGVDGQWA